LLIFRSCIIYFGIFHLENGMAVAQACREAVLLIVFKLASRSGVPQAAVQIMSYLLCSELPAVRKLDLKPQLQSQPAALPDLFKPLSTFSAHMRLVWKSTRPYSQPYARSFSNSLPLVPAVEIL
jgi:hypothetical protein